MNKRLTVTYRHDYDIIQFNRQVENILKGDSEERKRLDAEIKSLCEKIKRVNIFNQKIVLIDRMQLLEKQLEGYTSGETLRNYQQVIKPLLDEYNSLPKINHRIEFGMTDIYEEISPERAKILTNFFEKVNQFVPVDVFQKIVLDKICPNCQASTSNLPEPMDGQVSLCAKCGLHINVFREAPTAKETSDYKDRENFEKMIFNYQGLEKINFPDNIEEYLDKYFKSQGLPIGEEVRKMRLEGKPYNLGYKTLRKALTKDYSNLYDHIWLLSNQYWGTELADIRHLHEDLMRDYDITEKVFKRIKKNRKASINVKWRLRQQLIMRGYDVPPDDFKIVETREILEYYEDTWKQMCEGANDPNIRYIKSL